MLIDQEKKIEDFNEMVRIVRKEYEPLFGIKRTKLVRKAN